MFEYRFGSYMYYEPPYIQRENGKHGKITRLRINPGDLAGWMKQNGAEYTGDYMEGCLLDNFVASTRRGYAFIYETYVNPNMSDYTIYFQAGGADDLWPVWYERESKYINT